MTQRQIRISVLATLVVVVTAYAIGASVLSKMRSTAIRESYRDAAGFYSGATTSTPGARENYQVHQTKHGPVEKVEVLRCSGTMGGVHLECDVRTVRKGKAFEETLGLADRKVERFTVRTP